MIRVLGRIFRAVLWLVLSVVLVSVLASVAVTTGVVDAPGDGEVIDTPDPLPDWPFVWEVPMDDGLDIDTEPRSEPADPEDVGDPVREDPGPTSVSVDGATVTSEAIEDRVHERVDEVRRDEGLSGLDRDDEIATIARIHSHDMAARGYFSHVSPEGATPADRFGDLYPGTCRAVGENLALVSVAGSTDADGIAERIVDGWLDSDPHRENLLSDLWDRQGIGVYVSGDRVYATQNFCRNR